MSDDDLEMLKDAEKAIDALLIFAHQHTLQPLHREILLNQRIKRRIEELKIEGGR